MFKSFCLAVVAVALVSVSAFAADDFGKIDLSKVRDADNTVVEAKLNVDVDSLVQKTSDKKTDEAVEACCRSYGCCSYSCYRPCYSSCYSSCYCPSYNCYSSCYCPSYSCSYTPSYSCCYTPSYSCSYTPSYSCCYQPTYTCSYPTYRCCYQPTYNCCSYSSCWGCY